MLKKLIHALKSALSVYKIVSFNQKKRYREVGDPDPYRDRPFLPLKGKYVIDRDKYEQYFRHSD